jgi:hypothetical protein
MQRVGAAEHAERIHNLTVQMSTGERDLGLNIHIKPDNGGWHYFDASLPTLPSSSYPLSVHTLWLETRATRLGEPAAKGVSIIMDNFMVIDAETGESQIVEDFETLGRTLFLSIMDAGSIYHGLFTRQVEVAQLTMDAGSIYHGLFTRQAEVHARSGDWAQLVSMSPTRPGQMYPLRMRQVWVQENLPALASPAFLQATQLEVGDVVRATVNSAEVDFQIAGAVDYFPTMYERYEAGYLVTSRDLLIALFNETMQASTNPNEVLLATDGSTTVDNLSSLVPLMSQSWSAESVRRTLKANPLALGLRSVTFFGSALTITLSFVGFATHFYLSVRQREALYGVMRAMGMSARQLYTSIAIEQAVLILSGLALGTGLGVLLNRITLPRLPVSLSDQPPIPPFVPREDWLAVGGLYLILAVAFLIVLGIVTALLWRARVHRVMRIGQE